MKTFKLGLGSSPVNESCVQTTEPDYDARAHAECQAYANQLARLFKSEHGVFPSDLGIRIYVKGHSHDFGTYYEVVGACDEGDREALEHLFWLDANVPTMWDASARKELGIS